MFSTDKSDWMPDYLDFLNSQRKLGYTIEAAIADIADNPYDAGASVCYISLKTKAASARSKEAKIVENIVFSDNGVGMNKRELRMSLIPASTGRIRKYDGELGYFGCGLVASGLSLGNKIEVFTRGVDGDYYTYIDWNEKLSTNSPVNVVRPCTPDETTGVLNAYLMGASTGTVVWVSDLKLVHKRYDVLLKEIEYHLSTTYYGLREKYTIFLDKKKIEPWDFLEKDQCPKVSNICGLSDVKTYTVTRDAQGRAINSKITLQMSYVKEDNPKRKFDIMGRTNDNQGGALVRNGRMLTRGDMMGIEKKNPAHNALRFVVSYDDSALDNHIFTLTVQKDKCLIQDKDFKQWLDKEVKEFISEVIKPLNEKFRKPNATTVSKPGKLRGVKKTVAQVREEAIASHPVLVKLKTVNLNTMTPIDAVVLVQKLQAELNNSTKTVSN